MAGLRQYDTIQYHPRPGVLAGFRNLWRGCILRDSRLLACMGSRRGAKKEMNPLHLLWIVPMSVSTGVLLMAILISGSDDED